MGETPAWAATMRSVTADFDRLDPRVISPPSSRLAGSRTLSTTLDSRIETVSMYRYIF
ncbi:hypothetical protein [Novosphingobium soli]|uniref:hypothetical protein n=1 Tax=Novosphingobium soli TaxID=574956 RepID=UPI0036D20BCB